MTSTATVPDGNTLRAKNVATGDSHSCAVAFDGAVSCWGEQVSRVSGVTSSGEIAVGTDYACAVTIGGDLACWALSLPPDNAEAGDRKPALGVVSTIAIAETVVSLSADAQEMCGVVQSRQVYCWSRSLPTPAKVPLAKDVRKMGGDPNWGCVLDVSSKVWCWSSRIRDLSQLNTREPVTSLDVGVGFACATVHSGKVLCWGSASFGQLGSGLFEDATLGTPATVVGVSTATEVHTSLNSRACARTEGGRILCWGDNSYGAFGDGTYNQAGKSEPRPISAATLPVAAAFDLGTNAHGCAIDMHDMVFCWGNNGSGQLASGNTDVLRGPVYIPRPSS